MPCGRRGRRIGRPRERQDRPRAEVQGRLDRLRDLPQRPAPRPGREGLRELPHRRGREVRPGPVRPREDEVPPDRKARRARLREVPPEGDRRLPGRQRHGGPADRSPDRLQRLPQGRPSRSARNEVRDVPLHGDLRGEELSAPEQGGRRLLRRQARHGRVPRLPPEDRRRLPGRPRNGGPVRRPPDVGLPALPRRRAPGRPRERLRLVPRMSKWQTASRAFHKATNLPLDGRHLSVPCASCHIGGVFKGTPTRCFDCHWIRRQDDLYRTQLGNDCENCHRPISWTAVTWNHAAQTGFALNGAHASLRCDQCHKNRVFAGTPTDCYSCHAGLPGRKEPGPRRRRLPDHVRLLPSGERSDLAIRRSSTTRCSRWPAPTPRPPAPTATRTTTTRPFLRAPARPAIATDYQNATTPVSHAGSPDDVRAVPRLLGRDLAAEDAVQPLDVLRPAGAHAHHGLRQLPQERQLHDRPNQSLYRVPSDRFPECDDAGEPCRLPDGLRDVPCLLRRDLAAEDTVQPFRLLRPGRHPRHHGLCQLPQEQQLHDPCNEPLLGLSHDRLPELQEPAPRLRRLPDDLRHVSQVLGPTWQQGTFLDHSTVFPLVGAHLTTACANCHKNNNYTTVPTSPCSACHATDFQNATTPVNHAGLPTACETCHAFSDATWQLKSTFNHSTYFAARRRPRHGAPAPVPQPPTPSANNFDDLPRAPARPAT